MEAQRRPTTGSSSTAVGKRYSGCYTPRGRTVPLPRVHFWAIYNEPNFGQDLGPQMVNNTRTPYAPMAFRNLLNAGWKALQRHRPRSRHDHLGRVRRPRHQRRRPPFNARHLASARAITARPSRCSSSASSTAWTQLPPAARRAGQGGRLPDHERRVAQLPGQEPRPVQASGVSDHPYANTQSPVTDGTSDPNYATFPNLGRSGRPGSRRSVLRGAPALRDLQHRVRLHHQSAHTRGAYPSPATAAYYINWAEYLSYKNPRVKSYMQYLLTDPPPTAGAVLRLRQRPGDLQGCPQG